jgi:ubiquinone/menaquinone biosynthesis C-methylase UbiE
MTQNIYDNDGFFAGYSQLNRSVQGLDGAPEWPVLRGMLPDIAGRRVVDLGCGFGWFCRWAREHGAAEVLGLDVSDNMLNRARASGDDPAITYTKADLERLDLPEAAFDLAYSSLALHYIVDAARLFATVHRALAPGGRFVFSTEHPILMAPRSQEWTVDATGQRIWPLDGYLMEGPRVTEWLAKGVIKQHRTIATTLTLLINAGFTLTHVVEWNASDEQLQARPEWNESRDRPMFLLVAAQR